MDWEKVGKIVASVLLVVLIFGLPCLFILALKSDVEALKQQNATLTEFIDRQFEWNESPTKYDLLFDKRIDMLEQKMRKVYGGYDDAFEWKWSPAMPDSISLWIIRAVPDSTFYWQHKRDYLTREIAWLKETQKRFLEIATAR